jgi:hypothetical protein
MCRCAKRIGGARRRCAFSRHDPKAATLSSESIATPAFTTASAESCAACGAPLADDQRYCLQCGERRTPISSVLLGGPPSAGRDASSPAALAPPGPPSAGSDGETGRGGAATVIAGVGVLLLAMGVGVLIGRSSASPQSGTGPAQVISVSAPGLQSGASTTSSTPESTVPEASATNKESAKHSSSTQRGSSSDSNGAAQGATGAGGGGGGGNAAAGGSGKNTTSPKSGSSGGGNSGKSYEERSKNLPNVVSTG